MCTVSSVKQCVFTSLGHRDASWTLLRKSKKVDFPRGLRGFSAPQKIPRGTTTSPPISTCTTGNAKRNGGEVYHPPRSTLVHFRPHWAHAAIWEFLSGISHAFRTHFSDAFRYFARISPPPPPSAPLPNYSKSPNVGRIFFSRMREWHVQKAEFCAVSFCGGLGCRRLVEVLATQSCTKSLHFKAGAPRRLQGNLSHDSPFGI